ncbi:hypothetical protein E2C01_059899 [Portunus trituberculatus]|uniref:Uncharacterized protein n=1 Tax=Portunus trituberculatus TaxID=210409 RepID=A0A5B7H6M6_PORTR|nr:hypothetical protein [Portunus trituberculatus]
MLSRHLITSLCISLCSSVPHVLVLGGTLCNYKFSFLQFLFFYCYSHYFHFVLSILSRTIISTLPPPLSSLSLLKLLYPSSLNLTWIGSLVLFQRCTLHQF